MNRIILADNQAIFRAGAARTLALEEDMRIVAQCEDAAKLSGAIESFRGSVVMVATSLRMDWKDLVARTRSGGCRVILVAICSAFSATRMTRHPPDRVRATRPFPSI